MRFRTWQSTSLVLRGSTASRWGGLGSAGTRRQPGHLTAAEADCASAVRNEEHPLHLVAAHREHVADRHGLHLRGKPTFPR